MLKQIPIKDKNSMLSAINEIAILQKLQHPRVVSVMAVFHDTNMTSATMAYLHMPYYSGGTLRQYLEKKPSDDKLHSIFRELMHGIGYLHDSGVVHGDLKEDNVLMSEPEYLPVISDFGLSKQQHSVFSTQQASKTNFSVPAVSVNATLPAGVSGTKGYVAPEVIAGKSTPYLYRP